MSTPATRPVWICTTCRVEIRHRPTIHVGVAYCCAGCVADGPCTCSYDDPPETRAEDGIRVLSAAAVD